MMKMKNLMRLHLNALNAIKWVWPWVMDLFSPVPFRPKEPTNPPWLPICHASKTVIAMAKARQTAAQKAEAPTMAQRAMKAPRSASVGGAPENMATLRQLTMLRLLLLLTAAAADASCQDADDAASVDYAHISCYFCFCCFCRRWINQQLLNTKELLMIHVYSIHKSILKDEGSKDKIQHCNATSDEELSSSLQESLWCPSLMFASPRHRFCSTAYPPASQARSRGPKRVPRSRQWSWLARQHQQGLLMRGPGWSWSTSSKNIEACSAGLKSGPWWRWPGLSVTKVCLFHAESSL